MGLKMYETYLAFKFDFFKSLDVTSVDRRVSDVTTEVRELTGDRGVDIAYTAVGSKESLQNSHTSTKEGSGQMACHGMISPLKTDGSGTLLFDFTPPRKSTCKRNNFPNIASAPSRTIITTHKRSPPRAEFPSNNAKDSQSKL